MLYLHKNVKKIGFALCVLFASCGGAASDGKLAVLDVAAAIDGDALLTVDDIAESVEFIPLADGALLQGIDGLEEAAADWRPGMCSALGNIFRMRRCSGAFSLWGRNAFHAVLCSRQSAGRLCRRFGRRGQDRGR